MWNDEQGPLGVMSAEELTLSAVPLVHDIVREISARVPSCVNLDELLSAGLVSVLTAAQAYEPAADGDFLVYANAVVRSDVLVALRTADVSGQRPVHPVVEVPAPDKRLTSLREAIDSLEERHRQVLDGYFIDERGTAGLAAEMGLAEAQVVQLRTEALMLLRDTLRAHAIDAHEAGQQGGMRAAYAAVAGRRLVQASSLPDGDELPHGAA
jgi:RNA polymerase sigma factor (sigma-70 family)